MRKKQNIVQGAVILLVANFIVKILGALFKIPLTNLLGASGIGTFSVAYNIYVLMFVISTAGLPVSISKMISEEKAVHQDGNIPKIMKCAILVFVSFSIVVCLLIMIFAKQICILIANSNAYLSILVICPAIVIITVVSILRGYYQGYHNMTYTAVSQLIEAIFKLGVGYFFAKYLIDHGYDETIAAAGAIFGVTVSTVMSAIYLIFHIIFRRERYKTRATKSMQILIKKLLSLSIPVTISASMLSLISIIDMATIMNKLNSMGMSTMLANTHYGAYNMAVTVYALPQTLISALAISVIPSLAEAFAKKNTDKIKKTINMGLSLTFTLSIPCAIGFIMLAKPILDFLYYKRPEDVLIATPVLVILSLAVLFVSIATITNANMQAVSKQMLPMKSIAVGIVIKFLVNFFMIEWMGISGAALGTALCFFVVAIFNLIALSKMYTINFDKILIKPAIAAGTMGFCIHKLVQFLDITDKIQLLLLISSAGIVYFGVLYVLGGTKEILKGLGNGKI